MDIIQKLAEQKLKEAIEEGWLEDIVGKGKPIPDDCQCNVPDDLRIAYKMLKNSGYLPPEVEERKKIQNTRELLEATEDVKERYKLMQKLNLMITRFNMKRKVPISLEEGEYYSKIADKYSK